MKTLKRLGLFISLLAVIFIAADQSPEEYFVTALERLESKGIFVFNQDTFKNTTQVSDIDTTLATKQYVLNQAGAGNGWDSLTYSTNSQYLVWMYSGNRLDSLDRDGRFIRIADSTSNEQYNYVTHAQLDSAVQQSGSIATFYFILPIAGTLSQSVANAIDVPSGWTITSSGNNVLVEHNLGRYAAPVTVSNNTSGSSYRQYRGFGEGYTGILNVDDNNLTIEGFIGEYTSFNLRVQITFEQ